MVTTTVSDVNVLNIFVLNVSFCFDPSGVSAENISNENISHRSLLVSKQPGRGTTGLTSCFTDANGNVTEHFSIDYCSGADGSFISDIVNRIQFLMKAAANRVKSDVHILIHDSVQRFPPAVTIQDGIRIILQFKLCYPAGRGRRPSICSASWDNCDCEMASYK